jgi:hypothetical protein
MLSGELNHVQSCNLFPKCGRGDRDVETKYIAYPPNSSWLWTGPVSAWVDVQTQNNLIADALARAQAAKPANKSLRRIDYLYGTPFSQGFIHAAAGASATYSQCGAIDPNQ